MSADKEDFLARLRDDPNEALELREALAREASVRVAFDEAKGLARLHESIGAALPNPVQSPARSHRRWSTSIVPWIGCVLLLGGASATVRWFGGDATPAPAVRTSVASPLSSAAVPPPRTEAIRTLSVESLPEASLPEAPSRSAPIAARAAVSAQAKPPKIAPTSAANPPTNPLEETLHLSELRHVAVSDPQRALSMVEQGNRRFAGGSFREERDAIAVGALAGLGRRTEAKQAGEVFLAAYPTSPFAPNVRRAAGL